MITEALTCPRCGRALPDDAPWGLCPTCLMSAALTAPDEALADESSAPPEAKPIEAPEDGSGPSSHPSGGQSLD